MSNINIHVSTNKVGSEQVIDSGISEDEWNEMSEREQQEIIGDVVAEYVNTWTSVG